MNALLSPVCWRLVAGPESTLGYTTDRRPAVAMWTADRSGKMRRGDVVLIYGTKRLQSYVAVGRVCSDPRQNDRAQRLKKNRTWWVYLQVQPLTDAISRTEIEAQPFVQHPGSGLKTPAGASTNRLSSDATEGMAALLRDHDSRAAKRFDAWLVGRGAYPKADLDLEELRWAEWAPPEVTSPEELKLARRIAAYLVDTHRFRYLTDDDVDVPTRVGASDATALSLEHPIHDLAGRGRVDILLVDQQQPRTLLAIEVKLRATPAPARNPIPQITRYRQALTDAYGPDWRIDTLIVAEHFADLVIDEADAHGIAHRLTRPNGRLVEGL